MFVYHAVSAQLQNYVLNSVLNFETADVGGKNSRRAPSQQTIVSSKRAKYKLQLCSSFFVALFPSGSPPI